MQEKHLMFLETGPEMIEFKNAFLRPKSFQELQQKHLMVRHRL